MSNGKIFTHFHADVLHTHHTYIHRKCTVEESDREPKRQRICTPKPMQEFDVLSEEDSPQQPTSPKNKSSPHTPTILPLGESPSEYFPVLPSQSPFDELSPMKTHSLSILQSPLPSPINQLSFSNVYTLYSDNHIDKKQSRFSLSQRDHIKNLDVTDFSMIGSPIFNIFSPTINAIVDRL